MSERESVIDGRGDAVYVARVLGQGGFARTTSADDVVARAAIARAAVRSSQRSVANPAVAATPEPKPAVKAARPSRVEAPRAPAPAIARTSAPVLRQIRALDDAGTLARNPIAPPPKIAWIPVDRLVIDEGYQRAIGKRGRQNIIRLVQGWDWNCYKPLSVAPVEGRDGYYEVVDGQHSAIAAATHGSIELLPALVLSANSRAEKAAAFLGINRDRVTLTPFALFRARMASGEPVAVAVGDALDLAGVTLVESLQAGTAAGLTRTASIGTLSQLVRRAGGEWLGRVLAIAVAGKAGVITAGLMIGIDAVLAREDAPDDARIAAAIVAVGAEQLGERAMARGRAGDRAGRVAADAWVAVLLEAVLEHS